MAILMLSTVGMADEAAATQRVCEAAPTSQPTTVPVTAPALTAGNPQTDAILDQLEAKGAVVNDITARLTWTYVDDIVEETRIRNARLWYRREIPNARFLIEFDETTVIDDIAEKTGHEWIGFSDGWSIEKKEATRSIIKRQWAAPGRNVDLFTIGKGPFPLPFGQRKADILECMTVTRIPPSARDPDDTDHLLMIPKPDSEMARTYRRLDFYVDRNLGLPVRIRFQQKDDKTVTFDFGDIAINTNPPDSRFAVTEPRGYQIELEPLPPEPASDSTGKPDETL